MQENQVLKISVNATLQLILTTGSRNQIGYPKFNQTHFCI